MRPISARKRPMEIPIVDDSLSARVTMCELPGSSLQHRLTWLQDGEGALDFLFRRKSFARAPRPDVVPLDLGLPKRDGCEVLSEIKADDDLRGIPLVVLTASTGQSDAVDSELFDVESFMTKPVDFGKFTLLVGQLSHCRQDDMIVPAFA
jgi:CheY-like chemotaxis protein